jgi:hypothetical protein
VCYGNSRGKYNVGVISFPYQPWYRAYFYLEDEQNVIQQWMNTEAIPFPDRLVLQSLIDIYEVAGLGAISTYVVDLGEGLCGLLAKRRDGVYPCPLFCHGPFDEEGELTFLAGAFRPHKVLRPHYALGFAKERLEILREDPTRRRHASIT